MPSSGGTADRNPTWMSLSAPMLLMICGSHMNMP